jgi:DNA-binding CsgD family transcriptional regulator/PAS domain-containing protein
MKKPIDPELLSNLIGAIYDCAVDPARWTDTLNRVRIELDFVNCGLSLWAMPSATILLAIMAGAPPEYAKIVSQYADDVVEQWGGLEMVQSLPVGEPVVLSHFREEALWINNRYYQEWGKPQGIHDGLNVFLTRDSSTVSSIGFGRHESAGAIGEFEIAAVRLLSPHLTRAITIGNLLDLKSVVASTFESTLNGLAVAVLLADADLRIVHANSAAEAMLAAGDPIAARGRVLTIRSPVATTALAQAVRRAAADEAAIGKRGLGVPVKRADGTPCVLHVLPLRNGQLRPGLAPSAAAAIFVAPAVVPAPTPKDALAALFDLTPTEATVFSMIAGGMTQAEAAQRLAVETTTVKSHVLHIFTKTGVRRQADLVKLAASLAFPL